MSLKELIFTLSVKSRFQSIISRRCFSTKSAKNILETAEETPVFVEEEETEHIGLEEKRNKSRLAPAHRNMVHGLNPYDEPQAWYHEKIRYKKRVLGRYGIQALGVTAGIAWPTRKELEEIKEYEKIAFPLTIQERLKEIKEKKREREEAMMAKQQEIDRKMMSMSKMIADVQQKVAQKEMAKIEAQMKQDRKIEEVRRKLLAEGHVSKDRIEQELSQIAKVEKKKKKEAKRAKVLEKQQQWAKKLLDEANKGSQTAETVEAIEKAKEDN